MLGVECLLPVPETGNHRSQRGCPDQTKKQTAKGLLLWKLFERGLLGFFFRSRRGFRFTPSALFRAFSSGSFVSSKLFVSFPSLLARFARGRLLWCGRRCGAFDADFQGRDGLGMQAQFNVVLAQGPNRMLEMDFPLVERDVKLRLELVGNRAGG